MSEAPTSVEVLGCRLDCVDIDEATARILAFARGNKPAQVVTLGTEMVVAARRDARFRATLAASALNVCDTVGVLAAARRRGARIAERVTGVELLERLCAAAAREGLPIYLLGGAPGVAIEAARALAERYPGLRVAGAGDGYFPPERANAVAEEIARSGARMLFVGLGSPRQEFWIADHLAQSGAGAGIGVGGAFDAVIGKVPRAPESWRRLNLEWLYRLLREPHRWRRQLALPRFVALMLFDELRTSLGGRQHR